MGSYIILPNEFQTITSEPATAEKPGRECAVVRYLLDEKNPNQLTHLFHNLRLFSHTP